jgi:hypothetical protein
MLYGSILCQRWCAAILPSSLSYLDPYQLVLADKYDRFKVTYTGCHVFNPGSFVGKNLSWSAYKPSEANSEEW